MYGWLGFDTYFCPDPIILWAIPVDSIASPLLNRLVLGARPGSLSSHELLKCYLELCRSTSSYHPYPYNSRVGTPPPLLLQREIEFIGACRGPYYSKGRDRKVVGTGPGLGIQLLVPRVDHYSHLPTLALLPVPRSPMAILSIHAKEAGRVLRWAFIDICRIHGSFAHEDRA